MRDIDFFIIGAPKCGTTALARYLSEHPDVFVSNPKEPLYFLDNRDPERKIHNEGHYRSLFKAAGSNQKTGEASVWYLYSRTAMAGIEELFPNSKIIIMTRKAPDFVASLHSQHIFSGWEKDPSLERAWYREKDRLGKIEKSDFNTIEEIPDWRLLYPELALHGKYVDRWKSAFGTRRIKVIDLGDFSRDPNGVYDSVLSFLGLRNDGRTEFQKVNANKIHRSERMKRVLFWLGRQEWLKSGTRGIKRLLGIGTFGIYGYLTKLNLKPMAREKMAKDLENEIETFVRSHTSPLRKAD